MAEKIIKLKLQVDVTEGKKLVLIAGEQETSLKKVLSVNDLIAAQSKKSLTAYNELRLKVAQYNETLSQGGSAANLVFNQAQSSLAKYNRTLQDTIQETQRLTSIRNNLTLGAAPSTQAIPGFSASTTASTTPNKTVTPLRNSLTGQILQTEKEYQEKIRILEESSARHHKDILDQQLFYEKANLKSREVAYAAMFDEIAKKEKQHAQLLKSTSAIPGFSASTIASTIPQRVTAPLRNPLTGQIIQKETESLKENSKEYDRNNNLLDVNTRRHKSLIAHIAEAVSIYRVYNSILNLTEEALLNIPKAGIQAQASQAAIFGIFGSEKGRENLQFIKDLGNTAGQVVSDLEQSYAKFAPSAALAGANQDQINQIFRDFTEVSTILTLSKDKVDSVFLALDQIFSKGVVQSEEIKKQLGNALPGAVEIGAKAFGKSPAAFLEAMKNNEVIAKDFVPKFARLYREIFGGVDDSVFKLNSTKLLSNLNRLQTAYTEINRKAFEDTQGALNATVKAAAEAVEGLNKNLEGTKQILEAISAILIVRLGVAAVANINKLAVAFIGLRVPQLAVLGGVSLLTTELAGLNIKYEETTGYTIEIAGEFVNLADLIENEVIVVFEKFMALLATLRDFKVRDILKDFSFDEFGKTFDKNLALFSQGTGNAVTDTINEKKDKYLNSFKSVLEIQEAIRTKALQNNDDITKAFLNLTDYSAAPETSPYQESQAQLDEIQKKKEINFGKELKLNTELLQQEEEKYKAKLKIIELNEKLFNVSLQDKTLNISENEKISKQAVFEQQRFALEKEYSTKRIALAEEGYGRVLSVTKKSITDLNKALAVIQEIESSGNAGAVSRTGAIGLRQVQPSTLARPGLEGVTPIKVPQNVLDAEIAAKAGKISETQKKILKDYALNNVDTLANFGIEYYKALVKRYQGDLIKAAAAYNAGFGNEDKGIRPKETQDYLSKFVKGYGGENLETALLDQQTKKQTALDSAKEASLQNIIALKQKEADLANNIFERTKAEMQFKIEYEDILGNTSQSEKQKIKAEFEERTAQATKLGSEFLLRRLPVLQKERELAVEIADIKKRYETNERKFQNDLQEINNKVAIGILSQNQAVAQISSTTEKQVETQNTLIFQWKKLAEESGNVKDNVEAIEEIQSRIQKGTQAAAALKVNNFSPKAQLDSETSNLNNLKAESLAGIETQFKLDIEKDSPSAAEDRAKAIKEVEDNYRQKSFIANATYYEGIAGIAADSALSITKTFQAMYGERSKQAKAAFITYKAFSISETIIGTAKAAIQAYGAMAGIPYVGPFLGAAAAAAVVAAGAIQIATIVNQPLPAAHGGLTNVPAEQTYLLAGGERVLSPNQNRDFTDDLRERREKKQKENNVINNIRVINVTDESMVYSALGTAQGEEVIMNVVNRNRNN